MYWVLASRPEAATVFAAVVCVDVSLETAVPCATIVAADGAVSDAA